MQTYYQTLRAQYGFSSLVPDIRAGRTLTLEDSHILHRLQYANPRGVTSGHVAQAVRIMDTGRELAPFNSL